MIETENFEIEVGSSIEVTANVSSLDGSNCENKVIWKTSNNLVSLENISNNSVTVKTLFDGSTTVYAQSVDDSLATAKSVIKITFSPVMVYWNSTGLNSGLSLINKTGQIKKLIDYISKDHKPNWLPDGDKISFLSTRGTGSTNIFTVNLDGSEIKNITPNVSTIISHDWSPDGNLLVTTLKPEERDPFEIYTLNTSNNELKRLTFEGVINGKVPSGVAWSPDGSKILFSTARDSNWEIYSMNPDGSNQVNLTQSPESSEFSSVISSIEEKIFYISDKGGSHNIYSMNLDGSNEMKISNFSNGYKIFDLDLSSDGSKIAFAKMHQDGGPMEIWTIDINSSEQELLVNTGSSRYPKWKP
ncbi:MAG: hypothetical protein WDZ80_00915 [Candidatus Paceibacterota bacterium]